MRFPFLAFTLISSIVFGSYSAAAEIEWRSSLEAAKMEAIQTGKPVLVHFYGDGCPPCRMLERRAFKDDQLIASMNANAIPVKVNGTRDRHTASQYSVRAWPTDVFLFPNGQEAFRSVSKQDPSQYTKIVERVALQNRDWVIAYNKSQDAKTAQPALRQGRLAGNTAVSSSPNLQARTVAAQLTPHANAAMQTPAAARQRMPSIENQRFAAANSSLVQPTGAPIVTSSRLAQMQQSSPGRTPAINPTLAAPNGQTQIANPAFPTQNQAPQMAGQFVASQANGLAISNQPHANLKSTQSLGPASVAANNTTSVGPPAPSTISTAGNTQITVTNNSPQFRSPRVATKPAPTAQVFTPPTAPAAQVHTVVTNNAASQAAALNAPAQPNLTSNRYTAGSESIAANASMTKPTMAFASGSTKPKIVVRNASIQPNHPTVDATDIGLDGYCPVSLTTQRIWAEGKPELSVRHRGRIYQFADENCRAEFLSQPDRYAPALSGYDIVTFLEEGKLVPGSREFGFDLGAGTPTFLFSTQASMERFKSAGANYLQMLETVSKGASQDRVATEINSGSVIR